MYNVPSIFASTILCCRNKRAKIFYIFNFDLQPLLCSRTSTFSPTPALAIIVLQLYLPVYILVYCTYPAMSASLVQPHPLNSLDKHYNMPAHTTTPTCIVFSFAYTYPHIHTYVSINACVCVSKAQYHLCNTLEYCIELANIYYLIANIVGMLRLMVPVHHYRQMSCHGGVAYTAV